MIYVRSSIKIVHFVAIRQHTWPPQAILVSDWPISKKSSLKLHGQINWNLVGSIYVRSSTKIVHFVPIRQHTWPPQAILVSDWPISKKIFSLHDQINWNLVGSIYVRSSMNIVHFVSIRLQTWPPQAILVSDWLSSKKSSPLKPLVPQSRMKGERHRLSPLSL
jgi:hypothetical protein